MNAFWTVIICWVLAGLLFGCADTPKEYGTCKVPVMRDAGMGVKLPDCVYRTFP